jgi:hypothetical protein
MKTIKNTKDFKLFLREHESEIRKKSIRLQEISEDDEWVQENEWDTIYNRTVTALHA